MNRDEERLNLKDRKNELTIKMHEIEQKLLGIKNRIRGQGLMPKGDYQKLLSTQSKYRQAVIDLEKMLRPIKTRLQELADQEYNEKKAEMQTLEHNGDSTSIVRRLVSLREEYQLFAADPTRVGSMKQMAAQFVVKLNKIIREEIQTRQGNETPSSP
jgi:hypothetical protein